MEQNEANSYHEAYTREGAGSPEYQNTVARWGRMLTWTRVESILAAHSFSVADFVSDDNDPVLSDPLPELVDAAALYAWLGY